MVILIAADPSLLVFFRSLLSLVVLVSTPLLLFAFFRYQDKRTSAAYGPMYRFEVLSMMMMMTIIAAIIVIAIIITGTDRKINCTKCTYQHYVDLCQNHYHWPSPGHEKSTGPCLTSHFTNGYYVLMRGCAAGYALGDHYCVTYGGEWPCQ